MIKTSEEPQIPVSRIHVFDFDGTLTTRDTLLLFIRFACGRWALLWGLLCYSPLLVAMKLGLADNGKTKERLFTHFFRGMLERDFDALCQDFAHHNTDIFRTQGLKAIENALDHGDRVVVLSASIDRWVRPCLEQFFESSYQRTDSILEGEKEAQGPLIFLGTKIEVADGHLTGRFSTPNCYGPEKLRRLKELLATISSAPTFEEKDKNPFYIIAYGDSRGDKEILAFANEQHYKPFR
ncbi:MAG: haloacid dehalogenase-like hydrolase [Prevotella sp.]|nr:haloacid dehalogenase-like hydrolase [Prevotella sp.]